MSLRDLSFKAVYRSDEHSLLRDFYIPALEASTRYDRAVGFFSAGMLSYAAQGLSALIANAGRMRLIFGGELTFEDAEAIQRGYDLRSISDRVGRAIVHAIESVEELLYNKRLEALAYMIAASRLDVKVALRPRGMYHEKIGIFGDGEHTVVFQGSANETTSALLSDLNFESINVFPSWRAELRDHAQPYIDGFERLWANETKGTLVLDFPEAAREKLVRIARRANPPITQAVELALAARTQTDEQPGDYDGLPEVPKCFGGEHFEMRNHQTKALNAWRANACCGILAHATGSGKTITAIYGATKVFTAMKQLFLVVAVPYVNLAEQWLRMLRSFNITALACYGLSARWSKALAEVVDSFRLGGTRFGCVVVVDRTLVKAEFQTAMARIPGDQFLFVGDECHHHASIVTRLPEHARLRLGLSATPEDSVTSEVAPALSAYYGPVVDAFGLAEALDTKLLTPYEYHVVRVELTASETEEYAEITRKLGRIFGAAGDGRGGLGEAAQKLLFQRARLLGRAENKLVALRALLGTMKPQPLTLFYCGDGSTEDERTGESIRQVQAVSSILYEHHWRPAIFTADEDRKEREAILQRFRVGDIDALIAIRCLDEGIDIPACRAAYMLASAQSSRQYVQRRGRVLRRSPNKDRALVTDFVVTVPPAFGEGETYARNLLRSELRRVAEFARLAVNSVDAYRKLRDLLEIYDLVHLLTD